MLSKWRTNNKYDMCKKDYVGVLCKNVYGHENTMRWQKESAKPGPAETEIIMIVA